MKKSVISAVLFSSLPIFAFAQTSPTLGKLIQAATGILNALIPFAIGLGLVVFLFGIIKYMTAGSGDDKSTARNMMIYGVIALFVMVSVWGLVNFVRDAIGITSNDAPTAPQAPNLP